MWQLYHGSMAWRGRVGLVDISPILYPFPESASPILGKYRCTRGAVFGIGFAYLAKTASDSMRAGRGAYDRSTRL